MVTPTERVRRDAASGRASGLPEGLARFPELVTETARQRDMPFIGRRGRWGGHPQGARFLGKGTEREQAHPRRKALPGATSETKA